MKHIRFQRLGNGVEARTLRKMANTMEDEISRARTMLEIEGYIECMPSITTITQDSINHQIALRKYYPNQWSEYNELMRFNLAI